MDNNLATLESNVSTFNFNINKLVKSVNALLKDIQNNPTNVTTEIQDYDSIFLDKKTKLDKIILSTQQIDSDTSSKSYKYLKYKSKYLELS